MHNRINYVFVLDIEGKLFAALARQGLFRRFTRLYLAAHEFPKATLRLVRRTLPDKISIAIFYDGTNNFNYTLIVHAHYPANNSLCFSSKACDGRNLVGRDIVCPSRSRK